MLAVRGPDAEAYLQGQLSQDVAALAVGASADSLLLEPDGKLSALLRVTRTDGQGFVLDVDRGYGDAVLARLRRFLLRSKVELEQLAWRDLSLRGAGVGEAAAGLLTVLAERGVLALPFEWNGWTGVDLLGPEDVVLGPGDAALPDGITACGAEAVEACRIVSGIPAMGTELTGKTIAAEAGLVERTVSFTKGCYTGQELVARLDSRGSNVPRRLVGVVAPAGDERRRWPAGMTLHGGERARRATAPAEDKVVGTHHLRGLEQPSSGPGWPWATCTAAWRRPARSGCARATASAAPARPARPAAPDGDAATGTDPAADRLRGTAAPVPAAEQPGGRHRNATAAARASPPRSLAGWRPTPCWRRPPRPSPRRPTSSRRSRSSLLVVLVLVRWPLRPRPGPGPPEPGRRRHPWRAWVILFAVLVAWELAEYAARGSRADHPTLSSMLDAVDRYLRAQGAGVLPLAVPRCRHRAAGRAPSAP